MNACVFLSLTCITCRRFISQARWTRHLKKKRAERARSARRGEEKNKALVTSPLLWLFRHPTPTSIDWRRWYQRHQSKHDPLLENCRLSGYRKHRQQHNITTRTKFIFNNLRLSEVKVRFPQSKFSLCTTTAARKKRGKTCCSNQIPRWRAYERNVHVVNVGKATTMEW